MLRKQGEPDESDDYDDDDNTEHPLHHFNLKVVFDPRRNGLEETVNFPIDVGTVIAGRYRIVEYLGSGVFSRAVQCFDMRMGGMVCIKIIRNNKDFLDQSLGEIKLLQVAPARRPRVHMLICCPRTGCPRPSATYTNPWHVILTFCTRLLAPPPAPPARAAPK